MYLSLIDGETGEILAQSYNFDYLFTIAKQVKREDKNRLLCIF